MSVLVAVAGLLAASSFAGTTPAAAWEGGPVDLFYADQAGPGWPVADQVRRWDKSDRITLHAVPDCAAAPGPCVTISAHDHLPTWWGTADYDMGQPFGATWLASHIDPDSTYQPGRRDGTVWLTTTADAHWQQLEIDTGRPIVATMRAGLVCHELGHWLLQRLNDMHAYPYGCLSNIGAPYPGRQARALIPSWLTSPE